VNSTLACALVAVKRGVPVAHVEAGLRSFDRTMPEEINRLLTDQIADLLYTTERGALDNLCREGVDPARVQFVGNLMIDSLRAALPRAVPPARTLAAEGYAAETIKGGYGLVTLHRPSNVDEPDRLAALLEALGSIGTGLPLLWPIHPRTLASIERFGLMDALCVPGLIRLPPQGYLEMVGLMNAASAVLTDSGGIQEETTALGVPCLTLRENTERPITVTHGTNRVVGTDPANLLRGWREIDAAARPQAPPPLWDGQAAGRIAGVLRDWIVRRPQARAG
jgi:UDP-N-acetylglucosamine 2-epimerase (non-hydrolysing)